MNHSQKSQWMNLLHERCSRESSLQIRIISPFSFKYSGQKLCVSRKQILEHCHWLDVFSYAFYNRICFLEHFPCGRECASVCVSTFPSIPSNSREDRRKHFNHATILHLWHRSENTRQQQKVALRRTFVFVRFLNRAITRIPRTIALYWAR